MCPTLILCEYNGHTLHFFLFISFYILSFDSIALYIVHYCHCMWTCLHLPLQPTRWRSCTYKLLCQYKRDHVYVTWHRHQLWSPQNLFTSLSVSSMCVSTSSPERFVLVSSCLCHMLEAPHPPPTHSVNHWTILCCVHTAPGFRLYTGAQEEKEKSRSLCSHMILQRRYWVSAESSSCLKAA